MSTSASSNAAAITSASAFRVDRIASVSNNTSARSRIGAPASARSRQNVANGVGNAPAGSRARASAWDVMVGATACMPLP